MSRSDHSKSPRVWTERVRGVRYTVVNAHHRGPTAREAIREQLAEMLGLDTPAVIRLSSRVPESYDGLQTVGTYTIQSRGYTKPIGRVAPKRRITVRPGVLDDGLFQVDMDARPKVQHVIPTKRRVYDDSVRDCWRKQTSRQSRSLVDGPLGKEAR
jgi:hypothetical protein